MTSDYKSEMLANVYEQAVWSDQKHCLYSTILASRVVDVNNRIFNVIVEEEWFQEKVYVKEKLSEDLSYPSCRDGFCTNSSVSYLGLKSLNNNLLTR